jgi:hypothetical protein
MRQGRFRRGLLAATLGIAALAGFARSGEPAVTEVHSEPLVADEAAEPTVVPSKDKRLFPRKQAYGPSFGERVKSIWNKDVPLGCYSHFNDYSCSNFHSEVQFLWGGCRTFFGERCLKGPPGSPVPGFDSHVPERYYLGEEYGVRFGHHGYGKHGYGKHGRPGCIRCD